MLQLAVTCVFCLDCFAFGFDVCFAVLFFFLFLLFRASLYVMISVATLYLLCEQFDTSTVAHLSDLRSHSGPGSAEMYDPSHALPARLASLSVRPGTETNSQHNATQALIDKGISLHGQECEICGLQIDDHELGACPYCDAGPFHGQCMISHICPASCINKRPPGSLVGGGE